MLFWPPVPQPILSVKLRPLSKLPPSEGMRLVDEHARHLEALGQSRGVPHIVRMDAARVAAPLIIQNPITRSTASSKSATLYAVGTTDSLPPEKGHEGVGLNVAFNDRICIGVTVPTIRASDRGQIHSHGLFE